MKGKLERGGAGQLKCRFEEAERAGRWLHPQSIAERSALSRGVAGGKYTVPVRGWYARMSHYKACSNRERALRTIRSLADRHPGWTFCSFSAAILYGLQVPNALVSEQHVIGLHPTGKPSPLVRRHTYHIDEGDLARQMGIRATSLRRTLLDCLCSSSFRQGVAIADSALRWYGVDRRDILAYFDNTGAGRRGIVNARRVMRFADGRSENGGESIARAVMLELGFQIPELQVEVPDLMGSSGSKRADFGWRLADGSWIIGELDGLQKYLGTPDDKDGGIRKAVKAMSRERIRESHINLSGAKVVRFSFEQVLDEGYFERLLLTAGVPKLA